MRKDLFTVNNIVIDYNLLGNFPETLKKVKYEKMLDKFMESFEYTFTSTVFSYYGNLKEIRELIEDSITLEEIEFTKYDKEKQWLILILLVEKMFLDMHATLLGCEVVNEIFNNLDNLTEEDLKIIVEDINLSIYFAIEENILVTPTNLKELNASLDNVFLLEQLLSKEEEFEDIISKCKTGSKINKIKYEDIIKTPFNVKTYKKTLFNRFVFQWIDLMEPPINLKPNASKEVLDEICSDIFASVLTFNSLFFDEENDVLNITEELYSLLIDIFEETYKVDCSEES